MTDRDKELDELLQPLRENDPDQLTMQRLQVRVGGHVRHLQRVRQRTLRQTIISLGAAIVLGFVMGATYMGFYQQTTNESQTLNQMQANLNATIETIYANH